MKYKKREKHKRWGKKYKERERQFYPKEFKRKNIEHEGRNFNRKNISDEIERMRRTFIWKTLYEKLQWKKRKKYRECFYGKDLK